MGYGYDIISQQIINTIATIGGMICDGAKPSCASKISSALATSLDALSLAAQGKGFKEGEGIVKEDVDATVKSIGRMAREGMKSTDVEILNIMLGH
jgi:L-cysteine desulfidase